MKISVKMFVAWLLALGWVQFAAAQVQVNVVVTPPYPIHLDDYLGMGDKMLLTVTNTTNSTQSVKLLASVEGVTSGVKAAVKTSFQPQSPLVLAPFETKTLSGNQLRQFNGNLTDADVTTQGIDVNQILRTETLPEGYYNICVRAFDYLNSTPLSPPGTGCSPVNLTWYDPPVIVNPANQQQVTPVTPQFVMVNWTPAGLSGQTRYRLEVVDMTQNGLFNPNEAFQTPGVQPLFTQENLTAPAFPYSLQHPPLTACHQYALRVTAYDPLHKLVFKNQGQSPVSTFTYKCGATVVFNPNNGATETPGGPNDGVLVLDLPIGINPNPGNPPGPVPDPSDAPDCQANATVAEPAATGAHNAQVNEQVVIGKFKMKVLTVNGQSGTGVIFVNFLKTNVKVQFENLQVNNEGKAFGASKAWATLDQNGLIDLAVLNDPTGQLAENNVKSQDIQQFIEQGQRKVSKFTGANSAPIGVPFALDNNKGQHLNLLGLIFTPTVAYANTAFGMAIPEALAGEWLVLGVKGLAIRPNGFGTGDLTIALAQDRTVSVSDKVSLKLLKGANQTYVKFGCTGITEGKVSGALVFDRSLALPVAASGNVVAGPTKLEAAFSVLLEAGNGWVGAATTSHPRFALPQVEDLTFEFKDLVLDQSSTKNAPGMVFPTNHPKANQGNKNDWKGLYFSKLVVHFPDWMKRNGQEVTVEGKQMLLDKTGFWAKATISPVFTNPQDGDLGGWAFSIEQLTLDVQASNLAGAGIAGQVRLPVSSTDLAYSALISKGQTAANWAFSITTLDEVTVDAFVAKAVLAPNSTLKIEKGNDNKVKPSAVLNGSLTVGWTDGQDLNQGGDDQNLVSSFSLPTLQFTNLSITTNAQNVPQLNNFQIQLDNPNEKQGLLAGFPFTLNQPAVACVGGNVTLTLPLEISLTKAEGALNGLKGGAGFAIKGKYDGSKRLFRYQSTELQSIQFDNLNIAVATISGKVTLYGKDSEYGNGFKGDISATIKGLGIGIEVSLQAGNVDKGQGNFTYFFFDGKFKYEPGFQIPSTNASIYGFGGGFYFNMIRDTMPITAYEDLASKDPNFSKPGGSQTGLKYIPKKGGIGFSASVIFGQSGGTTAAAAFNGDLTFRMQLTIQSGIDFIELEGHVYVMRPLLKAEEKNKAAIHGWAKITIDFNTPSFSLNAGLDVNVGQMLQGHATLDMKFSPSAWWIHLGSWDTQNTAAQDEPWTDEKRCHVTVKLGVINPTFHAYFMMGSTMPGLPPLPKKIRDLMSDQEGKPVSDERSPFAGGGGGFGFGAGFHDEINLKMLIFYVDLEVFFGFDVLLKHYDASDCAANFGVNQWYAEGQAYAYLHIAAGLELNLWVWKGKFELIDLYASATLEAKFPNPTWVRAQIAIKGEVLNGLIEINTKVKFEVGKLPECMPQYSPFGDYPIVSQTFPKKNDKVQVYEDARLAFNFPKDQFSAYNEMTPEVPAQWYYYKVTKLQVRKGGQAVPLTDLQYNADGYRAKFGPKAGWWPEDSNLDFDLEVRGYASKDNKELAKETVKFAFKSAPLPDQILGQMLAETGPMPNQRFFLRKSLAKGYLKWRNPGNDPCYLFKNYGTDKNLFDLTKTKYLARITELETGVKQDVPCTCNATQVEYVMPGNLKASEIYSVQIVKQMYPKAQSQGGGGGINDLAAADTYKKQIAQGSYSINKLLAPPEVEKTVETTLWTSYFRTSLYNTLSEKMASFTVKGVSRVQKEYKNNFGWTYANKFPVIDGAATQMEQKMDYEATTYSVPVLWLNGGEFIDAYDAYGYDLDAQFNESVEPLIRFDDDLTSSVSGEARPYAFYSYKEHPNYLNESVVDNLYQPTAIRHLESPFLKNQLHPTYKQLESASENWDAYLQVWRKSWYGAADAFKPAGVSQIQYPLPPLSNAEITQAKGQAPQQGNVNIQHLNWQVNNQPQVNVPMPNLGLANTQGSTACLPILDVRPALAFHDYSEFLHQTWKAYKADNWWQPSWGGGASSKIDPADKVKWLNGLYASAYEGKAKLRKGDKLAFYWGGKRFSYEYLYNNF